MPVAAVELRPGAPTTTAEDLSAYAATVLARYEVPTEMRIVEALPRTDSAKVDLVAVASLFDPAPAGA